MRLPPRGVNLAAAVLQHLRLDMKFALRPVKTTSAGLQAYRILVSHLFYRAVHMRCTRDSNLVKGVNEIHHRFLIPEVIYRCHIGLQSLKMHFFSCF